MILLLRCSDWERESCCDNIAASIVGSWITSLGGACNVPEPAQQEVSSLPPLVHPAFTLPVTLRYLGGTSVFPVLLNSGAAGIFIDANTMRCLNITNLMPQPIRIQVTDGRPIRKGIINWHTQLISLQVWALHHENIKLLVITSPKPPVILGLPWMELHNPQLSWSDKHWLINSSHLITVCKCLKSSWHPHP